MKPKNSFFGLYTNDTVQNVVKFERLAAVEEYKEKLKESIRPVPVKIVGDEIYLDISAFDVLHLKECLLGSCSEVAKARQQFDLNLKEPKRIVLRLPKDKIGSLYGIDIYVDSSCNEEEWKLIAKDIKYKVREAE